MFAIFYSPPSMFPSSLDMTDMFKPTGAEVGGPPSPIKHRLEQWSPKPIKGSDVSQKLAMASGRRNLALIAKKTSAHCKGRSEKVKKCHIDAMLKLQAEILNKMTDALARAEAAKREAAAKATKMARSRVVLVREQTASAVLDARSAQTKRHGEAFARAESAKKLRAARGSALASPKVGSVRAASNASTETLKCALEAKLGAAFDRATTAKQSKAAKATAMANSKVERVRHMTAVTAAALKAAQDLRHAEARERTEEAKLAKTVKAKRMGSPVKRVGFLVPSLPPGSSEAPLAPLRLALFQEVAIIVLEAPIMNCSPEDLASPAVGFKVLSELPDASELSSDEKFGETANIYSSAVAIPPGRTSEHLEVFNDSSKPK